MKKMALVLLMSSALTACYVVPAGSNTRVVATPQTSAASSQAVASHTLQARLYPSNAEAQRVGGVNANVSIDQTGHGRFNAYIAGEQFSGDATREANSRRGTANGSAPSGRYIACQYTMNSATLGKGECSMSTGAKFEMHITR